VVIRINPCTVKGGNDRDARREGVKKMTKIRVLGVAALVALALALPQAAWAGPGTNDCWGKVTSQRASTEHDIGEHASAQEEPRMGLGNTARAFGFGSVGELGSFLASIDELDATSCP
jgi:hypothetical protein